MGTANRPYSTPRLITPGTDIDRAGQRGVAINASVAGDVVLKMPGGNLTATVNPGLSIIDNVEVIGVVIAGTTATATVSALS